jgi:tetratricopeptide (TPR) repeat protein
MGRQAEALSDCETAIGQDPSLALAYLVRGTARWQRAEYAASWSDFNQTIQLAPDTIPAYFRRGLAYAKLGQLPRAVADLTQALRLDPRSAHTYMNRAIVYGMAGQQELALHDLASAVQIDARYAVAYCNQRARVQAALGHHDQAAADYSVSLLIDRNNPIAQSGRAQAIRQLKSRRVDQATRQQSSETGTDIPAFPAEDLLQSTEFALNFPAEEATASKHSPASGKTFSGTSADGSNADSAFTLTLLEERDSDSASEEEARQDPLATEVDPIGKAETAEYLREQELIRQREQTAQTKRLAELRTVLEEKERSQQARAAAKRPRSRMVDEEDGESLFERLRQPLIWTAAVVVLGIAAYYGWEWRKAHRRVDPPLLAEAVCEEFGTDPRTANQKYTNRRICVVGKLLIEPAAGGREARDVFLIGPAEGKLQIHCDFIEPGDLYEVPLGTTPVPYLISGQFKPYSDGSVIEFTHCEFIGPSSVPAASARVSMGRQPTDPAEPSES